MAFALSEKTIAEIADVLDSGMKCYYHLSTGEIESFPDESRGYEEFEEEPWMDAMEKIDNNITEYLYFEPLDSGTSFSIMETFVETIPATRVRQRFIDAISYKKPFQNFKQLLLDYPDLRESWFAFKKNEYMNWVRGQVDDFDKLSGDAE
ncbi:MAG: hypothetical protein H7Y27_04265 [Gemmatimonadaceae bacterium]|nr:hypothetical protein [Chitinophagaceae bacterium]